MIKLDSILWTFLIVLMTEDCILCIFNDGIFISVMILHRYDKVCSPDK